MTRADIQPNERGFVLYVRKDDGLMRPSPGGCLEPYGEAFLPELRHMPPQVRTVGPAYDHRLLAKRVAAGLTFVERGP